MENMCDPGGTTKSFDPELINLMRQGKHEESLSYVKAHPPRALLDADGTHLLHVAAKYNSHQIVYHLVDSKCDVDVEDASGTTAFTIAATHRHFDVAQTLYYAHLDSMLERSSVPSYDIDSRDKIFNIAREELVSSMRKRRISPDLIGETLARATVSRALDVVRFHDASITKAYLRSTSWRNTRVKLHELFHEVVADHDLQHVLAILNHAPCDRKELYEVFCRHLMEEDIYDHYEFKSSRQFFRGIFSLEVFGDSDALECLERALNRADLDAVRIFLKYDLHSVVKARCNRDILACVFGNDTCDPPVRSLLSDDRIDVDGRGYDGKTPLHFAAERNSSETVRLLLERGGDPNAMDDKGRTPLALAIFDRRADLDARSVEFLLLAGADPLLIGDRYEEANYYNDVNVRMAGKLVVAQLVICEMQGRRKEDNEGLFEMWYKLQSDAFVDVCRVQLSILKYSRISEWSMFAILAERPEKLARRLGEEDARAILAFVEDKGEVLSSYYRDLLKRRAEDMVLLRSYRNRVVQVVCRFVGINDPHHLIVNKIVDYFGAEDLRKLAMKEERKRASLMSKVKRLVKSAKHRVLNRGESDHSHLFRRSTCLTCDLIETKNRYY